MRIALVFELDIEAEQGQEGETISQIGEAAFPILEGIQGVTMNTVTIVSGTDYVALQEHLGEGVCEILINGTKHRFSPDSIQFDEVLMIANAMRESNARVFTRDNATVVYRRATGDPSDGVMIAGDIVGIQDRTVFNVAITDNA